MKVIIDIPKDFTGDYITDKFKDFFPRVIADVDCKGICGNYEKEIAEMFLKAFNDTLLNSCLRISNGKKVRDNMTECEANTILNVPTVYDVDKIVERLQDESCKYMDRWFKTSEDADFAKMEAFDKAVEIVKGGMVRG